MFKKLWNSFTPPPPEKRVSASALDVEKLGTLVENFQIGRKLRYYPEYQRQIVFHTIVLAYRVNEHHIYSRDAILFDDEGGINGFKIGETKILPVEKLEKLHFLVPDTTEMEKTLDYFTRAELGRAGQFTRGNTITLVTESASRTIFTVDTTVVRWQMMKGGPYADSATIMIKPDLDSLKLTDKRSKQRMEASIRADLYLDADSPVYRCVLQDFSEASMRLRPDDAGQAMPAMNLDHKAIVEFDFGSVTATYRIRGKIMRRVDDFCVIQIEELYRDGEFERIKMMDIIELKSGLLNLRS